MTQTRVMVAVALLLGLTFGRSSSATGGQPARTVAPRAAEASDERTVWYFYRVRWGFQDEFLDLFQKNHYPILKAQVGTGRLTRIQTYVPTYHGDGRADWTFAVALTYRDAAALTGPSGEAEIARRLFPDQAMFRKEERRRFEILDAHWDVPLNVVDLETRQPALR